MWAKASKLVKSGLRDRSLGLSIQGFGRRARKGQRRIFFALELVGLPPRLGRTREISALLVDVGGAKPRAGILRHVVTDALVDRKRIHEASVLQQVIPEHHPRLEIAGIDDQRALDQLHGFVRPPDGDKKEGIGWYRVVRRRAGSSITARYSLSVAAQSCVAVAINLRCALATRTETLFGSMAAAFARASRA